MLGTYVTHVSSIGGKLKYLMDTLFGLSYNCERCLVHMLHMKQAWE